MRYRVLGRSGLRVSEIGLGCEGFVLQDDAFARSYALINPAFQVDSFCGYCDPVAVFGDIDPIGDITKERIDDLREYNNHTPYAQALRRAYDLAGDDTAEAIYFIEQVTGHLVPDVRPMLAKGIEGIRAELTPTPRRPSRTRRITTARWTSRWMRS